MWYWKTSMARAAINLLVLLPVLPAAIIAVIAMIPLLAAVFVAERTWANYGADSPIVGPFCRWAGIR